MMDTIGFLGCGNMGGAIARAVCKAVDPKKVFLANRTAAKAQALAKELGCKTATNAEVAGDCDLIFLAVKPQMMEALLQPLKFTFDERPSRIVLCSMGVRWHGGTASDSSCRIGCRIAFFGIAVPFHLSAPDTLPHR